MKRYLIIFWIFSITSGLSAQQCYYKKKNKIYFDKAEVVGADIHSFYFINKKKKQTCELYGKDKKNVYYRGKVIGGADSKTFKKLKVKSESGQPDGYWADENTIYLRGQSLPGSNPADYEEYFGFLLTGGKVFKGGRELSRFDSKTFRVLELQRQVRTSVSSDYGYLIQDKNGIYINEQKLDSIDCESLELIDVHMFKDKNCVYQYFAINQANWVQKLELNPDSLNIEKYTTDCNLSVLFMSDGRHAYLSRKDRWSMPFTFDLKMVDEPSFRVYAKHRCGLIFFDKNSFYFLDIYSNGLIKLPVVNKDIRLIYYAGDRSIIIMADSYNVYEIQSSAYKLTEDLKTTVFIEGNDVLGNKGFGAAVYMDKNKIRGGMERSLQEGEYEELMQYAHPASYYDSLRLKDLEKDSPKKEIPSLGF